LRRVRVSCAHQTLASQSRNRLFVEIDQPTNGGNPPVEYGNTGIYHAGDLSIKHRSDRERMQAS
jgi:hypothetical protein